ncbi:MAG: pilus assembly PilX family protein, partial [Verrucomicrobiales bacterium]
MKTSRRSDGFALVVTVSMMVLLTLLAVGMLGLASLEMKSSSRLAGMREAKANARLALSLAIGELQEHVGPDRRVTATGQMLAGLDNDQVPHPHWTVVWKTTKLEGDSVIQRDGETGGLRDARRDGWDPRSEALAHLVSGNEEELRYLASAEAKSGQEMRQLVGEGSIGEEDSFVEVPVVDVTRGGETTGQYAWWVGDLGVKANIATKDAHAESTSETAGNRRMQIVQDASISALSEEGELDNSVRDKAVSMRSLSLIDESEEFRDESFHALTTDSRSVLADVLHGGLKKDLTAYLESSGSIEGIESEGFAGLGIEDIDRLVGPPNDEATTIEEDGDQASRLAEVSPTFGLLRDWALRSQTTSSSMSSMSMDPAETREASDKMFSYGDHNNLPVEFKNRSQSDVSPVLTEASIFYNISYYDTQNDQAGKKIGLRLHLYPRVSIWNPYNFSLEVDPSMMAMQINGAKQIEVTLQNKQTQAFRMSWGRLRSETGGWQRWRRGTHYFKLDSVVIEPGQTVTFSPESNRRYDDEDFASNRLSPGIRPDATRSFYLDEREDGDALFEAQQSFPPNPRISNNHLTDYPLEWREFVQSLPTGDIQQAEYTQADDYFMYWKPITGSSGSISLADFMGFPHGRYVSCAFQYGDEDELPVEWSNHDPVFMLQSSADGVSYQTPDKRTRDGFRLRWLEEHPSNSLGSGSLVETSHMQSAAIANWNLRASYSFRSPFENVTDVAPHFFGIYTRDLFDDAVGWNQIMPRSEGGLQLGDPFEQPISGMRRILFDVPRSGAEIVSLGAFQHLQFSEFIWHPTYAFGNSLLDPRIDPTMTEPDRSREENTWEGGWNRDTIGYSTDGRSNNPNTYNSDSWAHHARGFLEQIVYEQNVFFDLSYELNYSLWDRFFLSSGDDAAKRRFLANPDASPLPNGRLSLVSGVSDSQAEEAIGGYHTAASALLLEGGFNVNSTSVDAWEAVLLGNLGVGESSDRVVFPRILAPDGEEWDGEDATQADAWLGQRTLSREEVRDLAEGIVDEVKLRGPFLSMADFVNRRLVDDETGRMGALEAALRRSG